MLLELKAEVEVTGAATPVVAEGVSSALPGEAPPPAPSTRTAAAGAAGAAGGTTGRSGLDVEVVQLVGVELELRLRLQG